MGLTSTITQGQSVPGNNDNERVTSYSHRIEAYSRPCWQGGIFLFVIQVVREQNEQAFSYEKSFYKLISNITNIFTLDYILNYNDLKKKVWNLCAIKEKAIYYEPYRRLE